MKRILLAALIAASLAGCNANPNDNGGRGRGWNRQIWTDPETGCQYHFWQSGVSSSYAMTLSPRIGSDGKPVCNSLVRPPS